ncbi:MAG TPA: isoprenyl transferase [Candidatus Omnitrophota bacterium]|nr:isoprenyl transferase [Candidatus Omnitrophota bacterium]HPN55413.1 isoprenyl transferase [Candidatus Omnitrophota bacterium]
MTSFFDKDNLPRHIAIIMDGNGRWAKSKNLPRFRGHLEGVKRIEEISSAANDLGIEVLTIFAFSTENWHRPKKEVSMLINMLSTVLTKRLNGLVEGNIRLRFMGKREGIPSAVLKTVDRAIEKTKRNSGLILNLAFNYGARQEIVDALKHLVTEVQKGRLAVADLDESRISRTLYTFDLPDPDLLIRTSGEQRISNFLLWQLSYSELYFTNVFWPDFTKKELEKALREFQKRERRFGSLTAKK